MGTDGRLGPKQFLPRTGETFLFRNLPKRSEVVEIHRSYWRGLYPTRIHELWVWEILGVRTEEAGSGTNLGQMLRRRQLGVSRTRLLALPLEPGKQGFPSLRHAERRVLGLQAQEWQRSRTVQESRSQRARS